MKYRVLCSSSSMALQRQNSKNKGNLLYQIGDFFVANVNAEDAMARCKVQLAKVEKELAALEAKSQQTKATMAELRSQLYSKFGNTIRLD